MEGMTQTNIGERNAAFVLDFLRTERINVAARICSTFIRARSTTSRAVGATLVKKLRTLHNDTILQRELDYRSRLRANHVEGDVELFG